MPFLCFNCKPRAPKFGDNGWEITLTLVTILLFILSFVEIVAMAQYSSVFSQSEVSACCGVIEENSFAADGALCHEKDIKDSNIEQQIFNGSALCLINGITCDEFNYHISGNDSDLETCLTRGGFPLTDVCGQELLVDQAAYQTAGAQAACVILCIIIASMTFFGVCEYIGCFEDSCWCQNNGVTIINKLIEIIVWVLLLIISQTVVENTAQNGYAARRPPLSPARTYLYDDCQIQNRAVMWIDFTLNMPEWLNSPGYQAVAVVGVVLSVIECLLFFIVFHKQRTRGSGQISPESPKDNMEKTIEMGAETRDTNQTANQTETNEAETQLETGNEDVGGSYNSDDDVLYDDEEKEMEYITPGGPGDTPGGPE